MQTYDDDPKNLPIQGGLLDFQDSGGGFDKGGEIQGEGLRPPSELCFGTNRLLCFMLIYYVYIPDPIIKLLVSVIQ